MGWNQREVGSLGGIPRGLPGLLGRPRHIGSKVPVSPLQRASCSSWGRSGASRDCAWPRPGGGLDQLVEQIAVNDVERVWHVF